jgi:hypothetical protein
MIKGIVTETEKYKQGWRGGLPETACGWGSRVVNTKAQREWIPHIIEKYGIKTIADMGAGDLNWITLMDMKGAEYTPYDLVPRKPEVVKFDLITQIAPKVDMLMCLWVLNHFPYPSAERAFLHLRRSGSKYLLMSYRQEWAQEQPPALNVVPLETLVMNNRKYQLRLIAL